MSEEQIHNRAVHYLMRIRRGCGEKKDFSEELQREMKKIEEEEERQRQGL